MKRKTTLITFACAFFIAFGLTSFDISSPSGAPAGCTGSPADGSTCTSCHGGTAAVVTGWITSDIPAEGYTPGTLYHITCTNNLTASGKYGFECSPQSTSGTLLGTLAAGTACKVVSSKYVTHSSSNSSTKTWTFSWTAPAATVGSVTFYAAFAKGSNGSVAKTSLTVNKASGVGISSIAPQAQLMITPNPSQGRFSVVNLPETVDLVSVFDLSGKVIYQVKQAETNSGILNIDLGSPAAGIYFLNIDMQGKQVSKKIVVK
ncbi:MAG: choice-of-anchor V domain-containing protein [Bacteroidota bacterium]